MFLHLVFCLLESMFLFSSFLRFIRCSTTMFSNKIINWKKCIFLSYQFPSFSYFHKLVGICLIPIILFVKSFLSIFFFLFVISCWFCLLFCYMKLWIHCCLFFNSFAFVLICATFFKKFTPSFGPTLDQLACNFFYSSSCTLEFLFIDPFFMLF